MAACSSSSSFSPPLPPIGSRRGSRTPLAFPSTPPLSNVWIPIRRRANANSNLIIRKNAKRKRMERKRGLVLNEASQEGSSQQPPLLSKRAASRSGSRLDAHRSDVDPRPRVRLPTWTSRNDRILLDVLAEHQAQGRRVGGLFSSSSWPKIVEDFNASSGLSLRKEYLQNRLKTMKGTYSLMKLLVERSGWSIDRTTFTIVAPGSTEWDDVIAVNSKYASVRDKPFPIYYDLEGLCGKNIATGKNSMSTTMQAMSGEGSSGDSDDPVDDPGSGGVAVDLAANVEAVVGVEPTDSRGQSVREGSTTQETPASEEVHVMEEVQVEHVSGRRAADNMALRVEARRDTTSTTMNKGKRVAVALTSAPRRRSIGGKVSELVAIAERRLDFQKEIWQEEKARRKKDHTVDDAMDRLNKLLFEGLDMRYFLAVCDLVHDPGKRAVFMKLAGPPLHAWLEHISHQGQQKVDPPRPPSPAQSHSGNDDDDDDATGSWP